MNLHKIVVTTVNTVEEVIEETSIYTTDDIYMELSEVSDKLDALLQYLQSSEINAISSLLLILIGFETMRLVRGWLKGGIHNGGYPH